MKAQHIRDIVFAHAIETAAPNEALPNAARRESITQDTLHALGKPQLQGSAGQAAFVQFLQLRAARIIQASNLPTDVRQLWQHMPTVARWVPVTIMLLALVLGFVSHRITDPHRVDLLSLSLMGIMLWNVLVYVGLAVRGVLHMVRPQHRIATPLRPTHSSTGDATVAPGRGWLHRLQAKTSNALRGSGLRPVALNFEHNWWTISKEIRHTQWLLWLHLGAALMAAGALASLWITGLTREYQVGWESTFLSAPTAQHWLNLLFSPTQWLQLTTPWSLADIQSLQGWVVNPTPAGDAAGNAAQSVGERWVVAYTMLLTVIVIVPRLALALWQALRWSWLARHMTLPLSQPYFTQLQRDFGGLATQLVVLPYSLDITPERRSALEQYAAQHYGAGASLVWQTTLAYGAELPAITVTPPTQVVLLISLAATPEVFARLSNSLRPSASMLVLE